MAEHPDEPRLPQRIVPDPETSLTSPRLRHPRPPRLWPLWLLLLVLLGALVALGWLGWEERSRLQGELARLDSAISNLHARFDAEEGRGDALQGVTAGLAELERRTQATETRLAELLDSLEEDAARREALGERLTRIAEAAATREAMLIASQQSLTALERTGEEGRAALDERLEALMAARDRDLTRLERQDEELEAQASRLTALEESPAGEEALNRLNATRAALEERLRRLNDTQDALEQRLGQSVRDIDERLETLSTQVVTLEEALDAASASRDDDSLMEALSDRIRVLETDIGELRRSQLALSARLEALRP